MPPRITAGAKGEFGGRFAATAEPGSADLMQSEVYRVVYWVGVAALVVWSVYSAYSAIMLS